MEVYIDDVVVKSQTFEEHIDFLEKAFLRMRRHQLKMNPLKCAFGVKAGNFLGFLVHNRGIEIDKNKAKAIMQAKPPTNKKELQRLLGQINFLRRFISNVAGRTKAFSPLLKLKSNEEFVWGQEQQQAFEAIKEYLTTPPVLTPPTQGKPLKLYISETQESIGSLLAQDNSEGQEQAIFYLSRILSECECKYSIIKKLCLVLYFSAFKLRNYMLAYVVCVIAQTDLVKYTLSRLILSGKLGKWSLSLVEFNLVYLPQKVVKGQALVDFLADHPSTNVTDFNESLVLEVTPWKLFFDGSKSEQGVGIGVVLESPMGIKTQMSLRLNQQCSHN